MKGISTILATILIVIIVVALVSLTYTFAVGLFGTASGGANAGVQATTIRLDKSVSIVGTPTCAKVGGTYNISFTIRHLGATYNISQTEISAYLGGTQGTFTGWVGNLVPGGTESLYWWNTSATTFTTIPSNGVTFTVSAPAADQSATIMSC